MNKLITKTRHNPSIITSFECKISNAKISTTIYSVCVLTGLRTEQHDQIMRWWSSKPQSGISQSLDSAVYCYVFISRCSCYSSPRRSYHTSSYAHLCVPCLHPIISPYHTSSFPHMGIYRLGPIITTSHIATPLLIFRSKYRILVVSS